MSIADRRAEEYRERVFEWNRANARWGMFAYDPPLGEGGSTAMVTCGVCGLGFLEPAAKAHHLEVVHEAAVWLTVGPTGKEFYEWRRVV